MNMNVERCTRSGGSIAMLELESIRFRRSMRMDAGCAATRGRQASAGAIVYSTRSASTGSTRDARRAGNQLATAATNASSMTAAR